MAKFTKQQRAERGANALTQGNSDMDVGMRQGYRYGWIDGHAAGTRDSQRRMARKFKQGLRLSFNT